MINEIAWYSGESNCESCEQLKKRLAKDFLRYGIQLVFTKTIDDIEEAVFFPFFKIRNDIFYSFYDLYQVSSVSEIIKKDMI